VAKSNFELYLLDFKKSISEKRPFASKGQNHQPFYGCCIYLKNTWLARPAMLGNYREEIEM